MGRKLLIILNINFKESLFVSGEWLNNEPEDPFNYNQSIITWSSILCRYELRGVKGLNFVLEKSLGGGGIAALNPDPQGKGYAQMLADFVIKDVPKLK